MTPIIDRSIFGVPEYNPLLPRPELDLPLMIADVATPRSDEPAADPAALIDHPSGFLALSSKNQHFTVPGINGFISVREQGRHVIALGGVQALESQRGALLDHLLEFAASRQQHLLVVQLRTEQIPLFRDRGFSINQLGTSFGLSLGNFTFRGTRKMQLRHKLRRARASGLKVVEFGVDWPRNAATFAELYSVSSAWLKAKGKKELDFMIGEIGRPEDARRRVFAAIDPTGRCVAFITYVPSWGRTPGYLHDLSRRLPSAPPGALELCNARAIEAMIAERVPYLHFGFTPFVVEGPELPGANRLAAWAVPLLYRYGGAIYPAASQVQYKLKWTPDIIEREYLAARPLSVRAVFDLLLLTRSL
jgi:lysylphosphatidylglycerol synthetase-like protein (DUF2156 family)